MFFTDAVGKKIELNALVTEDSRLPLLTMFRFT